jgi:predicted nucleic acid-binding protein
METTSNAAAKTMARQKTPILISPLTALEMHNAFQLAVFRKDIDSKAATLKRQLFEEDLSRGIFVITPIPHAALYQKAIQLADRYSASLGTRSLDLMHVAAAILLGCQVFLSFDERQRKVAKAEGLKVKP